MGINGLWDVIGRGDVVSIAKYATDHFNQHGRPLRVAVDEPGWRFNNLTPQQVELIRQKEPAANPIEKTIMWRIFLLMRLNIQPIWIFDGPGRPWKRNKRGGGGGPKVEFERTKLLCQLLDHLKVPHHRAPAEAEAECARLQQLGIVDAVWSDDGDTLMFGATCLIGAHRVGNKWMPDEIRVLRAEKVLEEHDLDSESLVLFAMLSGGDYNTSGLPGCGPKIARLVSRKQHGLAHALCHASARDLPAWRVQLQEVLAKEGKRLEVPIAFPDAKALGHYCNPVVSTESQLRDLRGLRNGWDTKINQDKLRILLRQRFNIWTKGYMKHIAPIFMVRQLARCSSQDEALIANMKFDIQLKKTRRKKPGPDDDQAEPIELEKKITFYPLPAVEIGVNEPEEEDWSIWETKDGSHYDPAGHVECNVLSCFLKHGLPEGHLVASEPQKRQRKTIGTGAVPGPASSATTPAEAQPVDAEATVPTIIPKKRGRPKKDESTATTTQQPKKRKKASEVDKLPTPPPRAVFRLPRVPSFTSSANSTQTSQNPILLDDEPAVSTSQVASTSQVVPPSQTVSTSQRASPFSGLSLHPSTPRTLTDLVPGEATSPGTLRALGAATWCFPPASITPTATNSVARTVPSKIPAGAEIIDLSD